MEKNGSKKTLLEAPDEEEDPGEETSIVTSCIGNIGRWQIEKCILLGLCAFPFAAHFMAYPLLISVEQGKHFWCADADLDALPADNNSSCSSNCSRWKFDEGGRVSIQEDFQLMCQREWLLSARQAVFFLGQLAGCSSTGSLSDAFGRKAVMLSLMALWAASALLHALATDYGAFLALQFALAFSSNSAWTTAWIWMVEVSGGRWRTLLCLGTFAFWCLGYAAVAPAAALARHWRRAWIALSAPTLLFAGYAAAIPESPVWLLSNGRHGDAKLVIDAARERNRRPALAHAHWAELLESGRRPRPRGHASAASPLDLARAGPNTRRRSCVLFALWFVTGLVYYGLSLNAAHLSPERGAAFAAFAASAAIEIPALAVSIGSVALAGRRRPLMALFAGVGLACLGSGLAPLCFGEGRARWLALGLAMLAKFGMASVLQVLFVYTSELYATPIRNTGVAFGSMFSKLGGIASPYFIGSTSSSSSLPIAVFGVLGVGGALGAAWLPETRGRRLPDTLEEGERFGRREEEEEEAAWGCCAAGRSRTQWTKERA